MIYPKKALAQLLIQACITHKIKTVVISPGSRNAPLSIGFHNNPNIESLSVVDERSAAFFALGIAQQTKHAVALVCTSGSALLNYYPAIAEAYFSNIPLIILSADRPKHLLDIGDGQTINQKNVFKNHILMSANLIEDSETNSEFSLQNFNLVHKTIVKALSNNGPVHINIPFDEPLYETTTKSIIFPEIITPKKINLLTEEPLDVDELSVFTEQWNNAKKKIVLIGVHYPSELTQTQINHILEDKSVLVFTETTSNVYHPNIINGIDKLIASMTKQDFKDLKPDILLTFGGMVVSKKIKQLFRNHSPKNHWHIGSKNAPNTYHCLTHHFKVSAELFFSQFFFLTKKVKSNYQKQYLTLQENRNEKHKDFLEKTPLSDLKVMDILLKTIPKKTNLQLSNSSIIRYTQLFKIHSSINVFCNRGTSGIDGSTSTAIGASYISDRRTTLITGDISFLYDNNALWNNYIKNDFRIILINNSGGGIFRFIPGPEGSNALDYFETTHELTAQHLCKMHHITYQKATILNELNKRLHTFYNKSRKPKLLEIKTPRNINAAILKDYFKNLISS